MRKPNRHEFIRKTKQIQAEGQSVFRIELIRQRDVPGLFLAGAEMLERCEPLT